MGIAKATLPNVCKMPGPPAPFIPSPLPNIATSGTSPKGYTKRVKVERNPVAVRGASFKSMGDIASKGTGGGLLSMNTHGPAKFITPGSFTVKFEGKSVHLLGEPMLNNLGASGSPPNTGATLAGLTQDQIARWDARLQQYVDECDPIGDAKWDKAHPNGPKHDDCWENSGRLYTSGKKAGKPMPVQVALGAEKEQCVYDKMKAQPGVPKYNRHGQSAVIQQRFTARGTPVPPGGFGGKGSIVPDVLYRNPSGAIAAVRDLKFPCPSGQGEEGEWRKGQDAAYARILRIKPELVFPL
jgi:hypothetical protein